MQTCKTLGHLMHLSYFGGVRDMASERLPQSLTSWMSDVCRAEAKADFVAHDRHQPITSFHNSAEPAGQLAAKRAAHVVK